MRELGAGRGTSEPEAPTHPAPSGETGVLSAGLFFFQPHRRGQWVPSGSLCFSVGHRSSLETWERGALGLREESLGVMVTASMSCCSCPINKPRLPKCHPVRNPEGVELQAGS